MKILFLVYHTLEEHSGISKKIRAQVRGLQASGAEVHLCALEKRPDGSKARVVDGQPIRLFGSGLKAKLAKRVSYSDISHYVQAQGIGLVYIRYDINADPFTLRFARQLRQTGAKVFVEIPTWPYDGEFRGQSARMQVQLALDRLFRRRFFAQVDRVVTFSDDRCIFGVPALNLSNGIDFGAVPLSAHGRPTGNVPEGGASEAGTLHLLSVANIHLWHGLDRLIRGMGECPDLPAELHIVGDGLPEIMEGYARLAREYGLSDRVKLLGPMYGPSLDREFAWADVAVGSLARHRSGINSIKTLKNREYAARGLAFFYSENDSDFDARPYVLKLPADETPVDLRAVGEFLAHLSVSPAEIRESIAHLSWDVQMAAVTAAAQAL